MGVRAEFSEETEERPPCAACKGIRGCMAVGGGSRADAQRAGAPGKSLPSMPSFIRPAGRCNPTCWHLGWGLWLLLQHKMNSKS